jgi:peptide/nickel transport system substrate-binding protein
MKKTISIVLAFLMLLAVASGCGSSKSETAGTATSGAAASGSAAEPSGGSTGSNAFAGKDTITIGCQDEPSSLDMQRQALGNNYAAPMAIYDTLFTYNQKTHTADPMVATKLEWVDSSTMKIQIRDDVYSSKGTHLTASDVIYTIARGCAYPGLANMYNFFDANNSKVVDDYNLILKLTKPFSGADARLCLDCFSLVCKADVESVGENDFAQKPVGTGPYVLTEWKTGDSITMTRNDKYWGEKPYFKTVTLKFIPDTNSRLLALQSGDIDVADKLTPSQIDTLNSSKDLQAVKIDIQSIKCIWLNLDEKTFADPRIRQALEMAIDKQGIIQAVFSGNGTEADGLFASTNTQFYTKPTSDHSYNVEKAKQLLADAGYPDGLSFTVTVYQSQEESDLVQALQSYWAKIGVNITINTVDMGTFFGIIMSDKKDAYIIFCPGFLPDMSAALLDSRNRNGGGNSVGYNNPAFDKLVDQANAETDASKRNEYWKQANDVLRNDYAFIPVCVNDSIFGVRKGLEGIYFDPIGDPYYTHLAPAK